MHKPYVSVIIAAAGNSTRMGGEISKQLITVCGKSIIEYSLAVFSNSEYVNEIVITAKEDEVEIMSEFLTVYPKISKIIKGGKDRQESVKIALESLSEHSEIIAIHDAARPMITTEDVNNIIIKTIDFGAVCPVSKAVDTVKCGIDGKIKSTIDRNTIFLASTPQCFKADIYKKAFYSITDTSKFTDDASIVEAIGQEVYLYVMENDNTKITTPKDLAYFKSKISTSAVRVGHGYDVHRLVENRKLILGGVDIPHELGLLGHSDADVLVHAIMDALLGAAALGDIGRHFPDTSAEYEGISSLVLLEKVGALLKREGYTIGNIDATVVAQAPKLAKYIPDMIDNIANALKIETKQINVKATTEERLGFTGEKLGISSHAVCTINT